MTGNITRRSILAAAPVVACAPAFGASVPSQSALIEAVMSSVVPYHAGFVAVKSDYLRALCEATGVAWGEHWATRTTD